MKKDEIKVSIRSNVFEALLEKLSESDIDNIDDIVEDALISYLGIKITDIQNNNNPNQRAVNYSSYVYVFMDPFIQRKTSIGIDDHILSYEPFYIGVGKDQRINESQRRNDQVMERINLIRKKGGNPIIIKLKDNLPWAQALKMESYLINRIGRKNLGKGPLLNICNGINIVDPENIFGEIGEYNLEGSKNNIILDSLNKNKFIRDAAKKLGISERTLYRRIKDLNIIWDGNKYIFKN